MSIRILYIPPYYEQHFELALDRLATTDGQIDYEVFTIDRRFNVADLNELLCMCRTIITDEHIHMLLADSHLGQLLATKLSHEYRHIRPRGMTFLSTLQCIHRCSMMELFDSDECIPTLPMNLTDDCSPAVKEFLTSATTKGYVKSPFGFDHQLASCRFADESTFKEATDAYAELYRQQTDIGLASLFRVYLPMKGETSGWRASYIVQPFYDLCTFPYWRLVIANACVYDKEIIMWPLVDGYSGWPFLAAKPLATMPIMVCPSRHLSSDQQQLVYARFRQHLNRLITNHQLVHGWIECAYLISSTDELRLMSIRPACSVHLHEGFNVTCQHGHPLNALVRLAQRQRPETPVLNGKTVYIHRLWTNSPNNVLIEDLINMAEVDRSHRSDTGAQRYVQLRFQGNDRLEHHDQRRFTELGFIQVQGDYHELGLANLIEFRTALLKQASFCPFAHQSMLAENPHQFHPENCLPSSDLLEQLERCRRDEHTDLL